MNIKPNPANRYAPGVVAEYEPEHKQVAKLHSVHNNQIAQCGHKVNPVFQPTVNCDSCWVHYFAINLGLAQGLIKDLKSGKEQEMVAQHGKKYVKKLKVFLDLMESLAANKEAHESHPADTEQEESKED